MPEDNVLHIPIQINGGELGVNLGNEDITLRDRELFIDTNNELHVGRDSDPNMQGIITEKAKSLNSGNIKIEGNVVTMSSTPGGEGTEVLKITDGNDGDKILSIDKIILNLDKGTICGTSLPNDPSPGQLFFVLPSINTSSSTPNSEQESNSESTPS